MGSAFRTFATATPGTFHSSIASVMRCSSSGTKAATDSLRATGCHRKDSPTSQLAKPNRSHLRAHFRWYRVVLEDLIRPTKAAGFPLHDEIPKSVRGSIDETRSLRVAAIGCRIAAMCFPIKGIQRIEGIPQFAGKATDCRRLLLTDLIFKDVLSCSQAHHDGPVGDLVPGEQATD